MRIVVPEVADLRDVGLHAAQMREARFPGGGIVAAEGRGQIETFLAHNTDARLQPSPGHLRPHLPANGGGVPDNPQGDHDGFFYALLYKHPG